MLPGRCWGNRRIRPLEGTSPWKIWPWYAKLRLFYLKNWEPLKTLKSPEFRVNFGQLQTISFRVFQCENRHFLRLIASSINNIN